MTWRLWVHKIMLPAQVSFDAWGFLFALVKCFIWVRYWLMAGRSPYFSIKKLALTQCYQVERAVVAWVALQPLPLVFFS